MSVQNLSVKHAALVLFVLLYVHVANAVINAGDLEAWQFFLQGLEPNSNPWYFRSCKCNGPNVEGCNRDGDGSPCGCNNPPHRVVCQTINGEERITEIVLPLNRLFGDFPRNAVLQMTELRLLDVSSTDAVQRDSNRLLDNPPAGCYRFDECFEGRLTCDFSNAFQSQISLCPPSTPAPTPLPTDRPTGVPTNRPTPGTRAPTRSPTLAPSSAAPTGSPTSEPPTSTPTTLSPTTAAPTESPSNRPTVATPAPTGSPTVLPTTSPTVTRGVLTPSEQSAWERVYDGLRGQDWRPCEVQRSNPCFSDCTGGRDVVCEHVGRRGLQSGTPQLSIVEISLPQNNVKGSLDERLFTSLPSLRSVNFESNPAEPNANFVQGSGPNNCVVLPMCFQPEFQCMFNGSGATVCDVVPSVSPVPSAFPTSQPTPTVSPAETVPDTLTIVGLALISLLLLLFLIFFCCFLLWRYRPELVPDPVERRFDSMMGKRKRREERDLQLAYSETTDEAAINQKDMIAKNPDLQKAKQEALDVERVVTKDINSVEELLKQAKMPHYTEKFRNEGVDLQAALLANNQQLKSLGLPLGDRVKFLRVTKLIREMR